MVNDRAGLGWLMCARRVAGPRSRALVVPLLLAAALAGLGLGCCFQPVPFHRSIRVRKSPAPVT